jgi:hypothetical protein
VEFRPGDTVPVSGVYAVEHNSHRLMHEATLLSDTRFPRCKQCNESVRFRLVRRVSDSQILPFRPTTFLEDYIDPESSMSTAV